jgi:hypothetical protein
MALIGGARARPGWVGHGNQPREQLVLRLPGVPGVRDGRRGPTEKDRSGRKTGSSGSGAKRAIRGGGNPRNMATPALAPLQAAALTTRQGQLTLDWDRRPAMESVPRRRSRATLRAGRRGRRLGLLLGGIALAFLLAFFSLAQTVRLTATDYEVDRLQADQARLQAQQQELVSDLNRLGREPAIRKQAIDLGLFPLADPIVIPSR